METKLRNLFALQRVDLELDILDEAKGDLPKEIREMEEKENAASARLAELEKTMRDAFAQRDTTDNSILALREKCERYKKQQYEVRNNKEYDALTKETDAATMMIAKLEKEMESLESKGTIARTEIETVRKELEEMKPHLADHRAALAAVSKVNEEKELQTLHEREKLVVRIPGGDLATYTRIRKAKKVVAVVPVRRNSCGGCYGRVPPQKLLELRKNDRIYLCEHCGRIIVSDDIVTQVDGVPQA